MGLATMEAHPSLPRKKGLEHGAVVFTVCHLEDPRITHLGGVS